MTPEQFCYWLQGFAEITDTDLGGVQPREWQIIRDHLNLVFKKETPDYNIKVTPTFSPPKPLDNWPHYPNGPLVTC